MAERRKYRREDVFLDAEITWSDKAKTIMQVRNICMGGIYLEADVRWLPDSGCLPVVGAEVDVTLLVHIEHEEFHTIKSRIIRVDRDGIALKFINIDVRYLSFLERVLEYKATKILAA